MYLDSIPPEDNKIYKKRREYDCACCRHFIKSVGNVISLKNGLITTIWDFETDDQRWNNVAKCLSDYVKQYNIPDIFISKFSSAGTDYNMMEDDNNDIIKWEHFYVKFPEKFIFKSRYDTIDTVRGQSRDICNVFKRSLDELTMDAVDTVLDLINQGSLYKGDEYKNNLIKFRTLKKDYDKLNQNQRHLFAILLLVHFLLISLKIQILK